MNLNQILQELKNRNYLNQKQLLLLQKLINQKLTAKQLSKETKIPLGRIYQPLNYLINQKLIEKIGKKPYLYSLENPQEKILSFLKNKFDNFVKDENFIIDLLDEKASSRIDLLRSKEDFTFSLIKLLSSCKKGLRTVARYSNLPFIFYPSNKKDFVKLRELITKKRTTIAHTTETKSIMVYQAYQDALKKGKYFRAICNEKTFLWHLDLIKKHLGKEFLKRTISDFQEKCKTHNIKLYIIKEYLPMQIFIIHNKIMLFHIHLGLGSGIEIQNQETRQLYKSMFNDMVKRSRHVEYYLGKV